MPRQNSRWSVIVVVVIALATPGIAWASDSGESAATPTSIVRQFVNRVWSVLSGLVGENGCSLDPNGCLPVTTPPPAVDHSENGCSLDPNGCPK